MYNNAQLQELASNVDGMVDEIYEILEMLEVELRDAGAAEHARPWLESIDQALFNNAGLRGHGPGRTAAQTIQALQSGDLEC